MATRSKQPTSPDYDVDGYGWAMAQAALIRAGCWSEVDIENVAEEIESVGKSEYDKLESALRVLLVHLLKWEFQPQRRGRSWSLTIKAQRLRYNVVLGKNPGLKSRRDEALGDAYDAARIDAARETDLDEDLFPAECPFDWAEILTAPRPFDPPSA